MIGLSALTEPCFLVFDVPTPSLDEALLKLRLSLNVDVKEDSLILRCREQRFKRMQNMNEVIENSVSRCIETLIDISNKFNRLLQSWRLPTLHISIGDMLSLQSGALGR